MASHDGHYLWYYRCLVAFERLHWPKIATFQCFWDFYPRWFHFKTRKGVEGEAPRAKMIKELLIYMYIYMTYTFVSFYLFSFCFIYYIYTHVSEHIIVSCIVSEHISYIMYVSHAYIYMWYIQLSFMHIKYISYMYLMQVSHVCMACIVSFKY